MSLLQVDQLVAGYLRGVPILRGVSLSVAQGEIVTVLGPNGAGKSTLVKSIAGLVPVFGGHTTLDGQPLGNLPAHRLIAVGLAYVPQTNNIFKRLSVLENLEMGGYPLRGRLDARIARVFDLFPELLPFRKQAAGRLSGGQRQMVAIGRALMVDPKLLILDEPSAGLSPKLVAQVFSKVRQIRDAGVTVLMVEQNAKAALQISDRGYVLAEGRERIQDQASALLVNPEVGELYLGAKGKLL
jgi:ABC-type branched-subunit amino acid transport system ATPase component